MFQSILESRHFDVSDRIVLDLSHNNLGNIGDLKMAVRHLFVLRKKAGVDPTDPIELKWLPISSDYVRAAERHERKHRFIAKIANFLQDRFPRVYSTVKRIQAGLKRKQSVATAG